MKAFRLGASDHHGGACGLRETVTEWLELVGLDKAKVAALWVFGENRWCMADCITFNRFDRGVQYYTVHFSVLRLPPRPILAAMTLVDVDADVATIAAGWAMSQPFPLVVDR